MERRVLIAVVLSFVVLYTFQALFPAAQDPKKPVQDSKTETIPNASAAERANPSSSVHGASPAPSTPAASGVAPGTPGRDVVLETDAVHATFTTRGAAVSSWKLKKFRDADGQSLEMIAGHAPADSPLPFTLATDDAAVTAKLASALYTLTKEPAPSGPWQADFQYADGAGLVATKSFCTRRRSPMCCTSLPP